ncbi:MAG: chorismate mutase [Oscillospiraceae bacterium]|nr:MAG: chorismate mutase [Oscillospiraceae bacterium]
MDGRTEEKRTAAAAPGARSDIAEARKNIDRIDREMAELFAERMQAAAVVAAYKEEHGLPVEDKAREAEMIARNTERLPPAYRPYYRNFLVGTITESKRYQRLLVSGLRVAYSGVEGAFAHVATMRIFGEPGEKVACPDFATAYRSVESGACHCAVLPIENSYAGDVGQVMDLAWRGSLTISGIYDLPLSQCLLAKPGVTLAEVREVVSHPQALAQCQPYLRRQGWIQTTAVNTAVAARTVAAGERREVAVIAARETADLYGLQVLENDINEQKSNTTRFAVFSTTACEIKPSDNHFVLLFSCKNQPGALGDAISVISRHDYNLKCLKSHPTGVENWAYYFYAEGEGNLGTEAGADHAPRAGAGLQQRARAGELFRGADAEPNGCLKLFFQTGSFAPPANRNRPKLPQW